MKKIKSVEKVWGSFAVEGGSLGKDTCLRVSPQMSEMGKVTPAIAIFSAALLNRW